MKYLKMFNESLSGRELVNLKNELDTYCDDNLAHLKDKGYKWHIGGDRGRIFIMILKNGLQDGRAKKFTWDDIKDDFLAFYGLIKNDYNLAPISNSDDFIGFNGWQIKISDKEIKDFDGLFTIPGRIPKNTNEITDIRLLVTSKK